MKFFLHVIVYLGIMYALPGQSQIDLARIASMEADHVDRIHSISSPYAITSRSFYLDENWDHLIIVTNDYEMLHTSGRINLVRKLIEIKVQNKPRRLNESKVRAVLVNGVRIIKVNADKIKGENETKYMKVLSNGRYTLLEGYSIGFKTIGEGALDPGIGGQEKLFLDTDLYYTTGFKQFTRIRSNNSIYSLLEDKIDDMKKYVDNNNLKLKKNRDVSLLFDYYNSYFEGN